MSWASRRRTAYLTGVLLFFVVIIGVPVAYYFLSIPPTCHDGIQNQGETGVDMGGPCLKLDPHYLQAEAVLWARAFKVRDGTYNAVAYVQNPNADAGVPSVTYQFGLYDANNVLIAERSGTTFIMPGGVTPIFEPRIDTGNRIVAHTYLQFTEPLNWEKMQNTALPIVVSGRHLSTTSTGPRLTATAANKSAADILDPRFVAVVYDTAGNAIAISQTVLSRLAAGSSATLTFTWPDPFPSQPGQVDITPLVPPAPASVSASGQ